MLSDFQSALHIHTAVLDALPVIGVGPKTVLEILLRHAEPYEFKGAGARFVALIDSAEICIFTGLSARQVQLALESLERLQWLSRRPKGYEIGYRSAGGSDVFYANESLSLLGQKLVGVEPVENRIRVVREWLNQVEEVEDARGV